MRFKFNEFLFWMPPILILIIITIFSFIYLNNYFVSVLISSLGIIYTTIWLYILLPMKERSKWKCVEGEVKKELISNLKNLFEVSRGYFKEGFISATYQKDDKTDEEKIWRKAWEKKLKETAKKQKLELSAMGKNILWKNEPYFFKEHKENLSEFEHKYFKFLKPEEMHSLIKMQKLLRFLINIMSSAKLNSKISKMIKSPSPKYYENAFCKEALNLFKEINNFNENLIKIYNQNDKRK